MLDVLSIFPTLCSTGYSDIAIWIDKKTRYLKWNIDYQKCIYNACLCGSVELMKYLYSEHKNNIDLHYAKERLFRTACMDGHLNIAQWLWEQSNKKINYGIWDNEAYETAGRHGHDNIQKWIEKISEKN